MLEEPLLSVFFGVALVQNSFGFRVGRDVGDCRRGINLIRGLRSQVKFALPS